MFLFITLGVFCLCTNYQESLASSEGYYWRRYNGTIPEDAIVGNEYNDQNNNNQSYINGKKIYIGQGYFHLFGIMVAPIYPEEKEIHFHFALRLHTLDIQHMKILCGNRENVYWAPTTKETIHELMTNKRGVIGGHHEKHGGYNIGRAIVDEETKIGRIQVKLPVAMVEKLLLRNLKFCYSKEN